MQKRGGSRISKVSSGGFTYKRQTLLRPFCQISSILRDRLLNDFHNCGDLLLSLVVKGRKPEENACIPVVHPTIW